MQCHPESPHVIGFPATGPRRWGETDSQVFRKISENHHDRDSLQDVGVSDFDYVLRGMHIDFTLDFVRVVLPKTLYMDLERIQVSFRPSTLGAWFEKTRWH
jgi:hypothetical protein